MQRPRIFHGFIDIDGLRIAREFLDRQQGRRGGGEQSFKQCRKRAVELAGGLNFADRPDSQSLLGAEGFGGINAMPMTLCCRLRDHYNRIGSNDFPRRTHNHHL